MLSSSSSPPLLLGSVVCDSMDHWFAPVKHCSELGSSCPLHCSTPHAVVCVHESSTMLNVYLLRTAAHQTWSCCRQGMQVSGAWQHLISWAALISDIIRCSGCFRVLWHFTSPMLPRWHAVRWWMSKDKSLNEVRFPDLVWTRHLERVFQSLTRRCF